MNAEEDFNETIYRWVRITSFIMSLLIFWFVANYLTDEQLRCCAPEYYSIAVMGIVIISAVIALSCFITIAFIQLLIIVLIRNFFRKED
jgi:TctA family transporter